ncbi:glycosyltransferase [Pseudomonas sp. J452]|uniref:glycosyltransferase family 2 protein n=1 Tax=Pseudomonas sp. J452 TaxID=2898441 RepID=UPI0021ADD06E|nr:glycosyltransferase family 2 protein [Pseudomonas sp. J452]UUY09034.1 glycosyltransferase [Pseudomonas sp. J452]
MSPLISIVLSTYNRPETLRLAIASVLAQSLQDWELLVVGDACNEETQHLLDKLADSRIHYINLVQNFGEQSGPNNLGIARARGKYIALLNHDDLWLPEHLQSALDWLQATGADLVFPATAVVLPCTKKQLTQNIWRTYLHGLGCNGLFDPVDTFAPASSWLMRRETAERIGPWRAAADCITASSREFLFRAWRAGLSLRALPWIGVVAFHSGLREEAYLRQEAHEQDWFWQQIQCNLLIRQQLLARAGNAEQPLRPRWKKHLLHLLATLGIFPEALLSRTRGMRRGQLIDNLRLKRGLLVLPRHSNGLALIRSRAWRSAPLYRLGDTISFHSEGNATAFQGPGWSYPESWGTWTDGNKAELHLRLENTPEHDLLLTFEGQCFLTDTRSSQRVDIYMADTCIGAWHFDPSNNDGKHQCRIPGNSFISKHLTLRFQLPDARSPASLGVSSDTRRLGLALLTLSLSEA